MTSTFIPAVISSTTKTKERQNMKLVISPFFHPVPSLSPQAKSKTALGRMPWKVVDMQRKAWLTH